MYEIACIGIPKLACSIIAARDKFISILIKAAISQWQDVSFQFLD